ncbi:Elongator subunit elp2 [Friedmanniomyces endolithicus]|uniref:Elongator complex protein 2 n=1 Tax=Friedmanniomyces endolithicus TaxID=329885 RepID=A0AAN6FS25_9PEZI|nr:Elongator subunit elp2 [Friedmanniomyces endolithicus]KAK0292958.1 Elongator subunit elp2 [Friedmanniomyces endolithicus]KAK0323468.1 Elongator subunit elp2 [Friedmanniomyces endolithicus]KAK1017718.1 Elongator subunit elp2 [Friedmanniomyces endolithicus]
MTREYIFLSDAQSAYMEHATQMNDSPAVSLSYTAAGGNRHPSAADWAPGLLAFGAGNNIALWDPEDPRQNGISALLAGHTDVVNVVKICDHGGQRLVISGGADKTVRVWRPTIDSPAPYEQACCLADHQSSINTISVIPELHLFVSGSADSTIKVWKLEQETGAKLIQSISLQPRYLPLTTALAPLAGDAVVLAVAGTSSSIQLYVRPEADADFVLQATLTGHEGWIRSLDLAQDGDSFLLASASQDKYIRLWRLRQDDAAIPHSTNGTLGTDLPAIPKRSLSNKSHQLIIPTTTYTATFEALLTGHEDWIYTARWAPLSPGPGPGPSPTSTSTSTSSNPPTLLSASADNSLALWTADPLSGVWLSTTRLGELTTQKGSTTATGSTGGFWTGLWQPSNCGRGVVSLSRTGSWRRWSYDDVKGMWEQRVGISGHTREVRGLAWGREGGYLLSTGADQTTRLFGEWKREEAAGGRRTSWQEFARPQIHGYDLNCIAAVGENQFVSGADEKLLRVFDKPKALDTLLASLSGTQPTGAGGLAGAAEIPVLGLSNKAITTTPANDDNNEHINGVLDDNTTDPSSIAHSSTSPPTHPPLEDSLSRHTLWPEHEKLYGHGHSISALATSPAGSLIATACQASSLEHAVIRLYETEGWREVKPPLEGHGLTVTGLAFASLGEGEWLLSGVVSFWLGDLSSMAAL